MRARSTVRWRAMMRASQARGVRASERVRASAGRRETEQDDGRWSADDGRNDERETETVGTGRRA